MAIKFLDLHPQYEAHQQELDQAMQAVIIDSAFVRSQPIRDFENAFAQYLGHGEVVSCGNGTDALEIILDAYNIGVGDEVIVPTVSWISTSEVVDTRGADVKFVDISLDSYGLDPALVEAAISERTRAIIVVHPYGYPLDMTALVSLSRKHNLELIEDCAQAHGATVNGQKVGTFGDAASFSFFPTKNLGAMGDAGCMVYKDPELAAKARAIANHGQVTRHHHELAGRNSRMDGLQAAVLNVKLKYLDEHIAARRRKAALYHERLTGIRELRLPRKPEHGQHAYHLYVVATDDRDGLREHLKSSGIPTLVHYPTALPFQAIYADRAFTNEDFPNAFRQQQRVLSLPFYPEIPDAHIEQVAASIKAFFHE